MRDALRLDGMRINDVRSPSPVAFAILRLSALASRRERSICLSSPLITTFAFRARADSDPD
jgi:hypothetical protein